MPAFLLSGALHLDAGDRELSPAAWRQIQALQEEKASFSPAQQKMDSQLVFAAKRHRNEAIARGSVSKMRIGAKGDTNGMVKVDIQAEVTSGLLAQIRNHGGKIVNSFVQFHAIRALVPLSEVESIAALTEVRFVKPAVPFVLHNQDPEGVVVHRDNTARNTFAVDGSGVKVGVISGSVQHLDLAQTNNDVGPVTVLSGQVGLGTPGEGTAMLEIVHAMAPGAQLYYAAGEEGEAQFAQNILDLSAAGCQIIVDDIGYPDEPPFQDGLLAQAVNTVTADGTLYFSAAGNGGNLDSGTSGTWQGDFVDGGPAGAPVNGKGGRIHRFGASNYDQVTLGGQGVLLFWSDPMGASTNDYDLYVLDSSGTNVVASSITVQNGAQDPLELIWTDTYAGERLVVVLASGDPRFLYLNTYSGQLAKATSGNIIGHPAATNAFAVAAVGANTAFPEPFTGGANNPIEYFSSDGPRQVFFQADGSPITPGNFSSTGGFVRPKPDIAAADGVSTPVPGPPDDPSGFDPFYGTSAAAPHAAAIAALIKSYNRNLSAAQIRSVLTSTALPMSGLGYLPMAPGMDRDAGFGIVMAYQALASMTSAPPVTTTPPSNQPGLEVVSPNVPGVTLTTLYSFSYGNDGAVPNGLVLGTNAIFYGTARYGGSPAQNVTATSSGYGSIFQITTNGIFTTLALFENTNGASPFSGLVRATNGALYGTTRFGGPNLYQDPSQFGYGTIFQLTANRQITPLAVFNGTNGSGLEAALVQGADGNFYGTTEFGGPVTNVADIYGLVGSSDAGLGVGFGTIFKVTPGGAITPLHYFSGTDGANPPAAMVQGVNGNFYGVTVAGGAFGAGTFFKVTGNGGLTTLHSFTGGNDGGRPFAAPVQAADGTFYGTTFAGGTNGAGTVFKMTTNGVVSSILSFNGTNGANPQAALVQGVEGDFYGTTAYGGPANQGTAFRIAPSGKLTTLVSFNVANGAIPQAAMVLGTDGSFYGTTGGGGTQDNGTIFRLTVAAVPPPVFQTVKAVNGTLGMTWSAVAGQTYQLQYKSDLTQSNWSVLTTVTATDSTASASDSTAGNAARFYRIVIVQ